MYCLAYEDKEFKGFYKEGVHKYIPQNHIKITDDLWQYLLQLQSFKIKEDAYLSNELVYNIDNKDLFEKVEATVIKGTNPFDEIDAFNAQLMLENAHKDIKIKSLEKDMANVLLQIAIVGGGA